MYTINYPVTIDVKLLLKGSDTLSVYQNIDIVPGVQNLTQSSTTVIICRTFAILGFNTFLKIFRDLEFRVSIGSLFHNFMDDEEGKNIN
jgi:hypothetical protein